MTNHIDTVIDKGQGGLAEILAAAADDVLHDLSVSVDERRARPQDDLLSDIAALIIDGEPIPNQDAVPLAFLVVGAGRVGGIGGLLYRVAQDADVRDQLIRDPALVDRAVEEDMRVDTPLLGLARELTADSIVDDVTMPAGDRVMLMWAAADRDPAVFENPDEIRLDRSSTQKHHGARGWCASLRRSTARAPRAADRPRGGVPPHVQPSPAQPGRSPSHLAPWPRVPTAQLHVATTTYRNCLARHGSRPLSLVRDPRGEPSDA